jgi:hypothetical protein
VVWRQQYFTSICTWKIMSILFFDRIILIFIILSISLETYCVRLQYFCDEFQRKIMYSKARTLLTCLRKYCKNTGSCGGSFVDFSLQKFVNSVVYVLLFPTPFPAWAAAVHHRGIKLGGSRCAQTNIPRTGLPLGHCRVTKRSPHLTPIDKCRVIPHFECMASFQWGPPHLHIVCH